MNGSKGIRERDFEEFVANYLTHPQGAAYTAELPASAYDRDLCLIPGEYAEFIRQTQPEAYAALQSQYGADVEQKIAQTLAQQIGAALNTGRKEGLLHVLRKGYTDRGQKLQPYFARPDSGNNPLHHRNYPLNQFTVIRQLRYSTKNTNELDLVIFLNGIPLLTAELKNALTGQYVTDAMNQYKQDRDPREPLLTWKRCLVHFAVSTEKVMMTTRLAGDKTRFLPFNQDVDNPPSEGPSGYATDYLWEDLWQRDSLLELVQSFVHVQQDTERIFNPNTRKVEEKKSEKMVFPRYHQRRAVRRLLNDLKTHGVGKSYLVQHSAGSGKSNTISWLAHRLSGFYQDWQAQQPLFDGVLVVTDRRALDKQIQDNIKQFELQAGVVELIDEDKSSQDLKRAIEAGARIIVTTLQKFPVISATIAQMPNRRYAVIIDEAHSSQTGESARHLRKALSLAEAEQEDGGESQSLDEIILEELSRKGRQPNISYFAFTATPKQSTLQLFGIPNEGGKSEPFDKYTMHQAIEEGFILDVLENYTTFRRYYKLAKRATIADKEYETRKAVRMLTSYVDLTDHAIELKSRIMLEHFASKTQNEIQGRARAMVCTRSRLHAVRYKRKFDDLMQEMRLPYRALVAFSSSVYDEATDENYTEASMNALGGRMGIPDAFKTPEYRILIVANKYQTGFDEPMLHTMFVDKKLGDVATVQTLSRLNRTMPGKSGTMVLDFVNSAEDVQHDFQDYYGANFMNEEDQTDPNTLYLLLSTAEQYDIFAQTDVDEHAEIFFRQKANQQLLQPILDRCVRRYNTLGEDEQVMFKGIINDFVRLYRFLSQIITFQDVDLEKKYVFLTHLHKKLPVQKTTLPTELLNEVELDSYKVQKEFEEQKLPLQKQDTALSGTRSGGAHGVADEEYDLLSAIIKTLNDAYGLNLTEEDKVDFSRIRDQLYQNAELMGYFNAQNSKQNIRDKFDDELDTALLQFVTTKLDLYNKLTEDKTNSTLKRLWFNELYDSQVRGLRQ